MTTPAAEKPLTKEQWILLKLLLDLTPGLFAELMRLAAYPDIDREWSYLKPHTQFSMALTDFARAILREMRLKAGGAT
jgi:hypothetical protein